MKEKLTDAELTKIGKAALDAAHAGGKVLLKHFKTSLDIREKKGAGLVTNADFASEKACLKILSGRFPKFGFLSEEQPPHVSKHPGRWVIDPLDGTTNYVHGFPMFCVSIGAEWNGEMVGGVIYHPVLDQTYFALRGRGAFMNGKKIRVSRRHRLRDALLSTGFTYRKDAWLRQEMQAFEQLSRVARAVRRPGSAALDLAYVACGVFDGFWERRLSPWDVAAGAILVEEAGGRVTDFLGESFRVDAAEILASNQKLHRPLLKEVSVAHCK